MNVFCQNGWESVLQAGIDANLFKRIRLFKNNHTPANSDTYASYTDADFSGYGGYATLTWGSPFINGGTQGEIDASEVTWTHNGGGTSNTVYGIFVTDASNNLIYAERFDAPVVLSASGDHVSYTSKITDVNQ